MSEKHLYEKHLAEKLQQLSPPPDMEKHWQEMKALLDDDGPRGGGFKRWWRIGVIAGLLLIGTWITGTFVWTSDPDKVAVADKPKTANGVENKSLPANAAGNEKDVADNGKGNTPAVSDPVVVKAADGGVDSKDSPDRPAAGEGDVRSANEPATPGKPAKKGDGFSEVNRSLTAGTKTDNNSTGTGKTTVAKKDNKKVVYGADIGNDKNLARNNPGKKNNKQTNSNSTIDDITVHKNKNTNERELTRMNANNKPVAYSPLRENVNYTNSLTLSPGDNLKTNFSLLSPVTRESLKSKSARSGKSRQERSFAFGFSLPLAFPLGDQKALSYNFNAGANTVSDYLPAPHVQYRFNKKTYLQSELQFISPQYIRPILLYEQRHNAGNYMVYNSTYARKLYYFNLPVGIHHSPFENFYLGTGLQFSTLLSGVGLHEETKRNMNGQPIALLSEKYDRLSGNYLSDRMNMTEIRLMLEANYYFNKFTFGLRYNQAFNNYVDFRIDPMSPYTFDKNKALQFYLRYNIFENVQRKSSSKGMLSSK
jgi:hypothetical protein